MLIYFIEMDTKARLSLCFTPNEIECRNETNFKNYKLINGGERKIPKGIKLTEFSWSGVLPAEDTRDLLPCIDTELWHPPEIMQQIFSRWRTNGTKLRLVITETPINHPVYIDEYNVTYKGPSGDYYYDIRLSYAPDTVIKTVDEVNNIKSNLNINDNRSLPGNSTNKTYTVKKGDSLWKIAQQNLGAGNRYMEIYNLNKDKISNPNTIREGCVLTLPAN